MLYTHTVTWTETLTKGVLAGLEVDKDFPIVNPASKANQRVLDRLIDDPNCRDARIISSADWRNAGLNRGGP